MTQLGGAPGLDWLLTLPDPRESGHDEDGGSVLRPLRASAGGAPASRLQSVKQPGGAGGASSSSKLAARPVGGAVAGSSVAGRARRPGSAQHNSNKLSRGGGGSSNSGGGGANMLAGLNAAPSAAGGMAGAMSVSGASHPAAYPASGVGMARRVPKVQAPLAQT